MPHTKTENEADRRWLSIYRKSCWAISYWTYSRCRNAFRCIDGCCWRRWHSYHVNDGNREINTHHIHDSQTEKSHKGELVAWTEVICSIFVCVCVCVESYYPRESVKNLRWDWFTCGLVFYQFVGSTITSNVSLAIREQFFIDHTDQLQTQRQLSFILCTNVDTN